MVWWRSKWESDNGERTVGQSGQSHTVNLYQKLSLLRQSTVVFLSLSLRVFLALVVQLTYRVRHLYQS